MPGRVKLLLIMLAAIGLAGFLAFTGLIHSEWLGYTAGRPAAPEGAPLSAAGRVSPPTEASTVADPARVTDFYGHCVSTAFPTRTDAEMRADACSKALQTRQLRPDQIALARLTRGVARTLLGNADLASEDYLDAVRRYDQVIDPANPEALALFRRAAALGASGQTDKALTDYTAAIEADPRMPLAYLGRGILLAARKRAFDRAIEDFDKVLALKPDNVDALIARGDAFSNIGDAGRAIIDLNRAVALAPDGPTPYLFRGLAEARRDNRPAARQNYRAALTIDPHFAEAWVNLAALDALEGKHEAAVRELDQAVAIDAHNPLAYYNRGYAHFALRQYDQAIADYSAAIVLDPRFGVAYNNRALVRAILGSDLVKALADSDEALKLLPLNLDVRETRGFVFLKLGDPALALHEYSVALEGDPNLAVSLYGRGLAKNWLGDARGAELDQAAALTINPDVEREFASYGL